MKARVEDYIRERNGPFAADCRRAAHPEAESGHEVWECRLITDFGGFRVQVEILVDPSDGSYRSFSAAINAASWGADGAVVLGGREEATGSCAEKNCEETPVLAAIDAAGNLETSFGEGGIVRAPEPVPAEERVDGFLPLPGGKVLAGGDH